MLNDVLLEYLPNKILQGNFNNSEMPLLKNRKISKEISIYLCQNFICKKPVATVQALLHQIQLQSF